MPSSSKRKCRAGSSNGELIMGFSIVTGGRASAVAGVLALELPVDIKGRRHCQIKTKVAPLQMRVHADA
jgi:hypothetical protein